MDMGGGVDVGGVDLLSWQVDNSNICIIIIKFKSRRTHINRLSRTFQIKTGTWKFRLSPEFILLQLFSQLQVVQWISLVHIPYILILI